MKWIVATRSFCNSSILEVLTAGPYSTKSVEMSAVLCLGNHEVPDIGSSFMPSLWNSTSHLTPYRLGGDSHLRSNFHEYNQSNPKKTHDIASIADWLNGRASASYSQGLAEGCGFESHVGWFTALVRGVTSKLEVKVLVIPHFFCFCSVWQKQGKSMPNTCFHPKRGDKYLVYRSMP